MTCRICTSEDRYDCEMGDWDGSEDGLPCTCLCHHGDNEHEDETPYELRRCNPRT